MGSVAALIFARSSCQAREYNLQFDIIYIAPPPPLYKIASHSGIDIFLSFENFICESKIFKGHESHEGACIEIKV